MSFGIFYKKKYSFLSKNLKKKSRMKKRNVTNSLSINSQVVYKCHVNGCNLIYYSPDQYTIHQELYDHAYFFKNYPIQDLDKYVFKCPHKTCDYITSTVSKINRHVDKCGSSKCGLKLNASKNIIIFVNDCIKSEKAKIKLENGKKEEQLNPGDEKEAKKLENIENKENDIESEKTRLTDNLYERIITEKLNKEENPHLGHGNINKELPLFFSKSIESEITKKSEEIKLGKNNDSVTSKISLKSLYEDKEFKHIFHTLFPLGILQLNRYSSKNSSITCNFNSCESKFTRASELLEHLKTNAHSFKLFISVKNMFKEYFKSGVECDVGTKQEKINEINPDVDVLGEINMKKNDMKEGCEENPCSVRRFISSSENYSSKTLIDFEDAVEDSESGEYNEPGKNKKNDELENKNHDLKKEHKGKKLEPWKNKHENGDELELSANKKIGAISKKRKIEKLYIKELTKKFFEKYNLRKQFTLTDVYVYDRFSRDSILNLLFTTKNKDENIKTSDVNQDSMKIIEFLYLRNAENHIKKDKKYSKICELEEISKNQTIEIEKHEKGVDISKNKKILADQNDKKISKNISKNQKEIEYESSEGETTILLNPENSFEKNIKLLKSKTPKIIYKNKICKMNSHQKSIDNISSRFFDVGILSSYKINEKWIALSLNDNNQIHKIFDFKNDKKGCIKVLDSELNIIFSFIVVGGLVLDFFVRESNRGLEFTCLNKDGKIRIFHYKTENEKLGEKESQKNIVNDIILKCSKTLSLSKITKISHHGADILYATDGFSIYKILKNEITATFEGNSFINSISSSDRFVFASEYSGKISIYDSNLNLLKNEHINKGIDFIKYVKGLNGVVISNSVEQTTKIYKTNLDYKEININGMKKNQTKITEKDNDAEKSKIGPHTSGARANYLLKYEASYVTRFKNISIFGDYFGEVTMYPDQITDKLKQFYTLFGLKKKENNYIAYKSIEEINFMKNFQKYTYDLTVVGIFCMYNFLIVLYRNGIVIRIETSF